ncbi:MAG TPA: phage/plasmid primase, P4 family, partial [Isosphaeraceae bacterium]|nr:phage/plasmid primase, P4 family [Isosphaeraceae bacterium]
KESQEEFRKWAHSCESKRAHEAAREMMKHQDGIPVVPDQLDANPWLLNCPNGTIDLTTGVLQRHRRSDLITKLCPVEFHPDATAPLWDEILSRFLPDTGLRDWVDRLFGYALTGEIREHLLAIFYGLGANGKTTILNALYGVMGTDYALKAPPDLLMQKKGQSHPTERASLFGKRLVIAAETGEGERFDESLVKELTGDEAITARRMREDFWSFPPTHKLILATNHKPSVKGSDNGIWRRLKLVEFGVSLEAHEQDTSVPARLREEYPGILARAVKSCLEWQQIGLVDPPKIVEATQDYKEAEDVYGQFIDENCIRDINAECTSSALYASYKEWAKYNGYSVASMKRFSKAMGDKGFHKKKNCQIVFSGIDLQRSGPITPDTESDRISDSSREGLGLLREG